ncbi:hypothetical protein [Bartonella acomydis]|uniref:Uncharacterized protein n=1 Tax=Bartonella acomydis TaxID=686234 RepID=A0ABP9MSN1_9HYPH
MTKMFKNYILNIFIVMVFFLSQVVNANANNLRNSPQKEEIIDCIVDRNKAVNIVSFHIPNLNLGTENNALAKGKIEKVLEPVTIGTFGIGMAVGYASSAVSMLLGWLISKIVIIIKSSH